ncbi:MAG: hypothetical protein ACYTEU_06540 [Planctomycetota bacterium]|jgi:hypothetical protein
MAENSKHNVIQDMKIENLEERIVRNESLIDKLAEGQIALQQSMTEVNTTLNMLLKMGKPALILLSAILGAIGLDVSGMVV